MKRIKKHISISTKKNYVGLFAFFFVIGILWGKFFYYSEDNRNALFKHDKLTVLAEVGFLPSDVVESYALESGHHIELITYSTREELQSKLKTHYDLVAFKSFNAKAVMGSLSKISYKSISNKDSISIDFKNPPYDPDNKFAVPLFWGVEKKETIEKSQLWVESMGISKSTALQKEAHQFLDYILQNDVTIEIVRYKKVASTNKNLEKEKNIESVFKPSYLRKLSIRDLAFAERASF